MGLSCCQDYYFKELRTSTSHRNQWTDSTVVLGWINTPPNKLKVFVSHRVTDLTSKVPPDKWLQLSPSDWPRRPDINLLNELPELKPVVLIAHPLPEEYGTHSSKLCRVTAWVIRFCNLLHNLLHKKCINKQPHLTLCKLKTSKQLLIKISQGHTFRSEDLHKVIYGTHGCYF